MLPDAGIAQQPIVADVAATWVHDLSGVRYPPALAGFERTEIDEYDNAQRDISATYRDQTTHTGATAYAFYAGLPDVSIWHDRIKFAMAAGYLGTPDFAAAKTTKFAPTGTTSETGLRTSAPMSGKGFTASGEAIFSHDGWLIAVRMTSRTLDRDALDAKLASFVAALPPTPDKTTPIPVYVIEECATRLNPPAARPIDTGPADALALIIDNGAMKTLTGAAKSNESERYCREAGATTNMGIYRLNGSTDSYVMALGDGGSAAFVGKTLVLDQLKHGTSHFPVRFSTVAQTLVFPGYDALPSYQQVLEAVEAGHPIASVSRNLGKGTGANINLFVPPDAKKAQ
jgi:hypothetical protein